MARCQATCWSPTGGTPPRYATSPLSSGLAAVTQTAPVAATTANDANAADPVEAPRPASSFKQAMGLLHALGCQEFHKVCVCMCVFAGV